jgi:hypothetical protein
LILNGISISTDTLLLPDWAPKYVRYELYNPSGDRVHFVTSQLSSVTKKSGSFYQTHTDWIISDSSGYMQIPAFAKEGTWQLIAVFHNDGSLLFKPSQTKYSLHTIQVQQGEITNSLQAPFYFGFGLPLVGDFSFGTPEIIYLIFGIIIIFLFLLIWFVPKKDVKKNVKKS